MVQSIAAAAEEQSAASEQVSRNIESISAISRQANEGTSQAAQAAQSLSSKAESLLQLVGSFKIDSTAVQATSEAPMSDEEKKLRDAARAFRQQDRVSADRENRRDHNPVHGVQSWAFAIMPRRCPACPP